MRGSQNGCHFHFDRMAVLMAVAQNISELLRIAAPNSQPAQFT
jgi:hypothetical protein